MKSLITLALFGVAFLGCVSAQIDSDAVFVVYNVTTSTPTGSGGSTVTIATVQTLAYGNLTVATNSRDTIVAGTNAEGLSNVCSTTLHPCDTNASACTDRGLSLVECSCNSGFNDTSTTTFSPSSLIPAGTTCSDINECSGNTTVCGTHTDQCINTPGSFTCNCTAGYALSSAKVCIDIDECTNATLNNCHANATCTNTDGSFSCACNAGLTGDGVTSCADFNECVDFGYDCGTNGTCVDNIGSYTCTCDAGYKVNGTLDPITCIDIDECMDGSDTCDGNATCTNTDGSFSCACNPGFVGDGMTCTDTDECAGTPGCHPNATCNNNPGSFTCICNMGYSGNGFNCTGAIAFFTYRAILTVTNTVTATFSDIETTIIDYFNSLASGSTFFFRKITVTVERVDNTTIILVLCFNETSHDANGITELLRSNPPSQNISGGNFTGDDFDECADNYGNCSASATCTNTNGSFTCVCPSSLIDQSTSGVSGTICSQPVNFTCFSDRVEVWAWSSFFVSNGVTNVTELTLGSCSGSDDGSGYWKFIGSCDGITDANSTHISTQWNLTNHDPNATIVVGSILTYPVSCLFPTSANVTFNFTAEQDNIIGEDQEGSLDQALEFTGKFSTDENAVNLVTGPVSTSTRLYLWIQPTTPLNSNLRLVSQSLRSYAATDPGNYIELISGGCPVATTSTNRILRDSLIVVKNGIGDKIVIAFTAHFYGSSTTTVVSLHLVVCIETGGASCAPSCTSGRRRRSSVIVRAKRQEEEVEAEVQASFQRDPEDACDRNCGWGICVLDAINSQQCVCTQQTIKTVGGTCVPNEPETPVATTEDRTTLWILVGLATALILLIAVAIAVFAFKRRVADGKDF